MNKEVLAEEIQTIQAIEDPLAIPSEAELVLMRKHAREVVKRMLKNRTSPFKRLADNEEVPNNVINKQGLCCRHQAKKWRSCWPAPGGLGLNEGRWHGKREGSGGKITELVKPKGGAGLKLRGRQKESYDISRVPAP